MEIEATAATAGGVGDINDLVFAALPEAVLINVASFLPTIPRGLFGVAMTEQSSAWRNADWNLPLSLPSQIILSTQEGDGWDVLDFRDIDNQLRRKLTDDDVGALIAAVDGRNKLKKLFLNNAHLHWASWKSFKGHGLEPLRGSDVMVQIDIDIEGIDEGIALPILESLIENRQSSLRQISLPKHWREGKSSNLSSFLRRYDDILYRLRFQCNQCGGRVGRSRHGEFRIDCIDSRGSQEITCYKCLNNFCTCCKTYDGEDVDPLFCNSCERFYCCTPIEVCGGCDANFCAQCKGEDFKVKCENWECDNPNFCFDCINDYDTFFQCSFCERHLCKKCSKSTGCEGWGECEKECCDDCLYGDWGCEVDNPPVPTPCEKCKRTKCKECRWSDYQEDNYVECEGCRSLLFPSLEEENRRLRKEVEELKGKLSSMQEG